VIITFGAFIYIYKVAQTNLLWMFIDFSLTSLSPHMWNQSNIFYIFSQYGLSGCVIFVHLKCAFTYKCPVNLLLQIHKKTHN
jgi:hypothetical protein